MIFCAFAKAPPARGARNAQALASAGQVGARIASEAEYAPKDRFKQPSINETRLPVENAGPKLQAPKNI